MRLQEPWPPFLTRRYQTQGGCVAALRCGFGAKCANVTRNFELVGPNPAPGSEMALKRSQRCCPQEITLTIIERGTRWARHAAAPVLVSICRTPAFVRPIEPFFAGSGMTHSLLMSGAGHAHPIGASMRYARHLCTPT